MPLARIADIGGPDFQQMLERARKISTLYDKFIEEAPVDRRTPGIHASEVSGCHRKIVYSLLAYEQRGSLSKNWRQRFQVGHAIHGMVQRDFRNMAEQSGGLMAFEDEVKIAPNLQAFAEKYFVHSSADGVFTFFDEPGGPAVLRVGLEIKTEAPDGYDKLKAPKPEHIDQAHIYMAALDVPLFWFFYMNKANQNNTNSQGPFLVQWNQQTWNKLEAKILKCHDYASEGELPPGEESMVCQFCSYSYTCQPKILISGTRQAPTKAWLSKK
jgi:CRISPR/Cas system-associated exonuclease Cas4 (RecB family)